MNAQQKDRINQYFFEKFYFAGDKNLACARDPSQQEASQINIRNAASNYRKALMVLSRERADFVIRHEAAHLMNKVWDKYDRCWIGSTDGEISLTEIVEKEVNEKLLRKAQKKGTEIRSNIKEFKSGLKMEHVANMRCHVDKDYDIMEPPDLSLLMNC
ncbi:8767_t:CDS:2, partial [Acaulospora morrowiae]